jgi:hypothetical protein
VLNNKKLVAGLAVLAVIVVVVAVWVMRKGGSAVAIDLISLLPDAQKSSRWTDGGGELFSVQDVTLGGETHKAIFAPPLSRIRWKIEVPRRGTLEVFFALREEAWAADGNGAQFRVGVSDGRTYEEYLTETVNPKGRERDRRWMSATIDLSAYEGQLVELNLSTDHGPKNDANDKRNDLAIWGDPKIVGR